MKRATMINHTTQQSTRATGPIATPLVISDGIEVTDDAVWAWAEIPSGSTLLMEDEELVDATMATSTALASLLPAGAEWHLKVMWASYRGSDYRASWDEIDSVRAPGAEDYIDLGAERIDTNVADGNYRQRIVLLGIRWPASRDSSRLDRTRRAATKHAHSTAARYRMAQRRCEAARPGIERWLRRMAESPLQAVAASAAVIAWSYARELRRGVALDVPDDTALSGGQLVSLMHGEVDPTRDDHYVVVRDLSTGVSRYVSVLVAAVNGFPPSELSIPGGEWLQMIADVRGVEASVRGVSHGQADSIALLDSARKLTRSQQREAAQHGAQIPSEVLDADQALNERRQEVARRLDVEVTTHPRWVVEAASAEELAERIDELQKHYAGTVHVEVVPYLQDLLWRELLPGDMIRVPEFAQYQPMRTFAGSWFHGGSAIGDTTGPYAGANLGTTPGPVRIHLTSRSEADRTRPTTVAFTGQSGTGKSTALDLCLFGALAEGAWGLLVDPKGDLGGAVEVASTILGVPVQVIDVLDDSSSGMMDPMRFAPTGDDARSLTLDALLGALHPDDRRRAETVVEHAIDAVMGRDRASWSCPTVISELVVTEGEGHGAQTAREIGAILTARAKAPEMRAVLGPLAATAQPMMFGRGLVYVVLAGLPLPRHSPDPAQWSVGERCAMATFKMTFAYALLQSRHARSLKKVVALTELHLITRYPEGATAVEWCARVGRALQLLVLLDSQAAAELAAVPGLVEQLLMSFAFRAEGADEQAGQAALARRPNPGPRLRAALAGLHVGQCVARDRYGRLAPIQWDLMTEWIKTTLNTDADEDTATTHRYGMTETEQQ